MGPSACAFPEGVVLHSTLTCERSLMKLMLHDQLNMHQLTAATDCMWWFSVANTLSALSGLAFERSLCGALQCHAIFFPCDALCLCARYFACCELPYRHSHGM